MRIPNVAVQPSSSVQPPLTSMANINRKPAWKRQPRTRIGGLYRIRLCKVQLRNLYAYALVAPLVDMITIVTRVKKRFRTLSHVAPSIREKKETSCNSKGYVDQDLRQRIDWKYTTRQNQRSVQVAGRPFFKEKNKGLEILAVLKDKKLTRWDLSCETCQRNDDKNDIYPRTRRDLNNHTDMRIKKPVREDLRQFIKG